MVISLSFTLLGGPLSLLIILSSLQANTSLVALNKQNKQTMIFPIAVPIAISAMTTMLGVATAITKKLSSCYQEKLNEYTVKHQITSNGYSQLSSLMSLAIDDAVITEDEFSAMIRIYDSVVSKLEIENSNNNNVRVATASTNRGEYQSGTNKHDINHINKP